MYLLAVLVLVTTGGVITAYFKPASGGEHKGGETTSTDATPTTSTASTSSSGKSMTKNAIKKRKQRQNAKKREASFIFDGCEVHLQFYHYQVCHVTCNHASILTQTPYRYVTKQAAMIVGYTCVSICFY